MVLLFVISSEAEIFRINIFRIQSTRALSNSVYLIGAPISINISCLFQNSRNCWTWGVYSIWKFVFAQDVSSFSKVFRHSLSHFWCFTTPKLEHFSRPSMSWLIQNWGCQGSRYFWISNMESSLRLLFVMHSHFCLDALLSTSWSCRNREEYGTILAIREYRKASNKLRVAAVVVLYEDRNRYSFEVKLAKEFMALIWLYSLGTKSREASFFRQSEYYKLTLESVEDKYFPLWLYFAKYMLLKSDNQSITLIPFKFELLRLLGANWQAK